MTAFAGRSVKTSNCFSLPSKRIITLFLELLHLKNISYPCSILHLPPLPPGLVYFLENKSLDHQACSTLVRVLNVTWSVGDIKLPFNGANVSLLQPKCADICCSVSLLLFVIKDCHLLDAELKQCHWQLLLEIFGGLPHSPDGREQHSRTKVFRMVSSLSLKLGSQRCICSKSVTELTCIHKNSPWCQLRSSKGRLNFVPS